MSLLYYHYQYSFCNYNKLEDLNKIQSYSTNEIKITLSDKFISFFFVKVKLSVKMTVK